MPAWSRRPGLRRAAGFALLAPVAAFGWWYFAHLPHSAASTSEWLFAYPVVAFPLAVWLLFPWNTGRRDLATEVQVLRFRRQIRRGDRP